MSLIYNDRSLRLKSPSDPEEILQGLQSVCTCKQLVTSEFREYFHEFTILLAINTKSRVTN